MQKDNANWMVVGLVLILVGIALFLFWSGFRSLSNSTTTSDDGSAIPMAVDYPAPQLELQSTDGTSESLADFRQNVLLVNNWATWCPPCKAEMPTLEAYFDAHYAQNFTIVAIEAGDPQGTVSQFAQTLGLKFHVWVDPQNVSLAVFRNGNLPNSYVIDRTGTVRYAWTGAINRTILEKCITPLLMPGH
ncbi:MAG TPA: TlpA disulfide reductase family protein [Anaerolineales bacterium]|nr:TlpA disulfide reductase family protein [Anaerolineales bacterium]